MLIVSKVTQLANECAWDTHSGSLLPNSVRAFSILSHSHGRFLDRFICGEGGLVLDNSSHFCSCFIVPILHLIRMCD